MRLGQVALCSAANILEKIFDTLINSFIHNEVGIADDFLNLKLAEALRVNLIHLFQAEKFSNAGTGNGLAALKNKEIRSDVIYWLDRSHNNLNENLFFDLMDAFVLHLNQTCYTGITSYEFHYTRYEPGTFYTRHIDQFQNNGSRKYSMILYLNEGWKSEDGGELCIHQGQQIQSIAPRNGKGVFFKSAELEHEVLITTKARMSITGWLKVD